MAETKSKAPIVIGVIAVAIVIIIILAVVLSKSGKEGPSDSGVTTTAMTEAPDIEDQPADSNALWNDFLSDPLHHIERLFQICDDTDLDRIVPSDFTGINVDLNQFGFWNVKGVLRIPGAAVCFFEAGSERQN